MDVGVPVVGGEIMVVVDRDWATLPGRHSVLSHHRHQARYRQPLRRSVLSPLTSLQLR
ncbi:MAG: hypothetical protein K0Q52_3897 [Microbacterium sp.]|nr:hypothetical protein [Microbacterium sp.]